MAGFGWCIGAGFPEDSLKEQLGWPVQSLERTIRRKV